MFVLFLTCILIYLAFCSFLYKYQDKLVFFPPKAENVSYEIDGYKKTEHQIDVEGLKQFATLFEKNGPGASQILLYFAGNASSMAGLEERVRWLTSFTNCSILLIDYPGYGKNEGTPTEASIYRILNPWKTHITEQLEMEMEDILVWGHSLGGGVACEFAKRYNVGGLVLENTFSSVVDIAKTRYPYAPVGWFCTNKFLNSEKLPEIDCPTLIIHSKDDEVIPFDQFLKLRENLSYKSQFVFEVMSGPHNGSYTQSTPLFIRGLGGIAKNWLKRDFPG